MCCPSKIVYIFKTFFNDYLFKVADLFSFLFYGLGLKKQNKKNFLFSKLIKPCENFTPSMALECRWFFFSKTQQNQMLTKFVVGHHILITMYPFPNYCKQYPFTCSYDDFYKSFSLIHLRLYNFQLYQNFIHSFLLIIVIQYINQSADIETNYSFYQCFWLHKHSCSTHRI